MMRYIDSKTRDAAQTVAKWMNDAVDAGVEEIRCQTGYYTFEGSSLLLPALQSIAGKNGIARFVIGSNRGATLAGHVKMLSDALALPRANAALGIVTFDNSLFHPKVYHFKLKSGQQRAYIGSSNMTGPGLSGLNIEAGILLDSGEGDSSDVLDQIAHQIDHWIEGAQPGIRIVENQTHIDELTDEGILSLQKIVLPADPGEGTEGTEVRGEKTLTGVRLSSLVAFKWKAERKKVISTRVARFGKLSVPSVDLLQRQTEASFHYPQGTHLGHLLSILFYFANGRADSAYADDFIRLTGGLGAGRIAAYRRQVKYKILAATEIGLLTDVRLEPNQASFVPQLTAMGIQLWQLIQPYIDTNDLIIEANEDGTYSSATPRPVSFYNRVIFDALNKSVELKRVYVHLMLSMPAAMQMLQYLFFECSGPTILKSTIYDHFFRFQPVLDFCDEMGIEPATESGARHRCPFLLNVLESCGVLTQTPTEVTLKRLAISGEMIATDAASLVRMQQLAHIVVQEWGTNAPSLGEDDKASLRELFGAMFLTNGYPIREAFEIGA